MDKKALIAAAGLQDNWWTRLRLTASGLPGEDGKQQLGSLGILFSTAYLIFGGWEGLLGLIPSLALRFPKEADNVLNSPHELFRGIKKEWHSITGDEPKDMDKLEEEAKRIERAIRFHLDMGEDEEINPRKVKSAIQQAQLNIEGDDPQEGDKEWIEIRDDLAALATHA